jgi:hypothetical protein
VHHVGFIILINYVSISSKDGKNKGDRTLFQNQHFKKLNCNNITNGRHKKETAPTFSPGLSKVP